MVGDGYKTYSIDDDNERNNLGGCEVNLLYFFNLKKKIKRRKNF